MKCKKLQKLGFKIDKKCKIKQMVNPSSFFGQCLLHLQRLKAHYHMLNTKYIKNLVKKIKKKKIPNLHQELISKLESRLDSLLFKSGLTKTIGSAAQLISHGKVLVDNKKVSIRSYQVPINSLITIKSVKLIELEKSSIPYIELRSKNSFYFKSAPLEKEVIFKVAIDFTKVIGALK